MHKYLILLRNMDRPIKLNASQMGAYITTNDIREVLKDERNCTFSLYNKTVSPVLVNTTIQRNGFDRYIPGQQYGDSRLRLESYGLDNLGVVSNELNPMLLIMKYVIMLTM